MSKIFVLLAPLFLLILSSGCSEPVVINNCQYSSALQYGLIDLAYEQAQVVDQGIAQISEVRIYSSSISLSKSVLSRVVWLDVGELVYRTEDESCIRDFWNAGRGGGRLGMPHMTDENLEDCMVLHVLFFNKARAIYARSTVFFHAETGNVLTVFPDIRRHSAISVGCSRSMRDLIKPVLEKYLAQKGDER